MLRAEVEAIAAAAEAAGVEVVTGDTKVVERGARRRHVHLHGRRRQDRRPRRSSAPESLSPGDRIIVSGSLGDHGSAIMLARGEFELESRDRIRHPLALAGGRRADAMPPGPALRCMRDATRGGAASALNELARASNVAMVIREGDVPRRPAVGGAAEMLGIDPMYIANEGKFVAFVAPEQADAALGGAAPVEGCEDAAAEIGEVKTEPPGMVLVETAFGGKRVLDSWSGDPLPRIC